MPIRKGSSKERELIKIFSDTFPGSLVIRSAGSRKVDVVVIDPTRTLLFEVKSTSSDCFYASRNKRQREQFQEVCGLIERGFTVVYAIFFLKRGLRFFSPKSPRFLFDDGKICPLLSL